MRRAVSVASSGCWGPPAPSWPAGGMPGRDCCRRPVARPARCLSFSRRASSASTSLSYLASALAALPGARSAFATACRRSFRATRRRFLAAALSDRLSQDRSPRPRRCSACSCCSVRLARVSSCRVAVGHRGLFGRRRQRRCGPCPAAVNGRAVVVTLSLPSGFTSSTYPDGRSAIVRPAALPRWPGWPRPGPAPRMFRRSARCTPSDHDHAHADGPVPYGAPFVISTRWAPSR